MFGLHRVAFRLGVFAFGALSICSAKPGTPTIYILDSTELNLRDLAKTRSELEHILQSTGAQFKLCVCRASSRSCCTTGSEGSRVLEIRIAPGSARHTQISSRHSLGHSIVDEKGGVYAVLFLDAIRYEASVADVPLTIVLAYAAAHEIGHLLLGPDTHTHDGIMKASWDRKDYLSMSQRALRFNGEQCRRITESCESKHVAK